MMSPRFGNGANKADRAPTATSASPARIRLHSRKRSDPDKPLCREATRSPNRALTRPMRRGVRAISGTNIRLCLP